MQMFRSDLRSNVSGFVLSRRRRHDWSVTSIFTAGRRLEFRQRGREWSTSSLRCRNSNSNQATIPLSYTAGNTRIHTHAHFPLSGTLSTTTFFHTERLKTPNEQTKKKPVTNLVTVNWFIFMTPAWQVCVLWYGTLPYRNYPVNKAMAIFRVCDSSRPCLQNTETLSVVRCARYWMLNLDFWSDYRSYLHIDHTFWTCQIFFFHQAPEAWEIHIWVTNVGQVDILVSLPYNLCT